MLAQATFEHYTGKPNAGFSSRAYDRTLSTTPEPPKARRVEIPPDLYGMSGPSPELDHQEPAPTATFHSSAVRTENKPGADATLRASHHMNSMIEPPDDSPAAPSHESKGKKPSGGSKIFAATIDPFANPSAPDRGCGGRGSSKWDSPEFA
jgi:hypothetical protein